jgi:hypothetical protein
MTETEIVRIEDAVKKKVAELMELVHTVQIITTVHDPIKNETHTFCDGAGNMFARLASTEDWIVRHAD